MRALRPTRRDDGQATLEYIGGLFVVVVLIGAVLLTATPIGQAIAAKICEGFGITCGSAAAQDRADALGIKCVVASRDNQTGINASVEVRADHGTKGAAISYGDGTSRVTLTENSGLGVDVGSTSLGKYASAKLTATGNGELAYVYSFPEENGGESAADDFFDSRRDVARQVIGTVVPGAQSIEEGFTRVKDGIGGFLDDHVFGSSDEDRAARDRDNRARQADAVQVALSLEGKLGLSAGAGVKKGDPKDPDAAEEPLRLPASADGTGKVTLKGTMTVPLHTDGPDAVQASFTGELSGSVDGSVMVGGKGPIPPFLNLGGTAGAKGQYTVSFDENGEPSKLVVTTETTLGGTAGTKPGSYESPAGNQGSINAKIKGNRVDVTTQTLDLRTDTAEGAANRAAFDQAFTVIGFSAGGYTGKAAVPNALAATTTPGLIFAPQLIQDTLPLLDRLNADAFTQTATYDESGSDYGGDIKILGVGGGVSWGDSSRQLVGATAHDNRSGADVQLANCQ